MSLSQVVNQRKRRARSAARRSRKVVDLVDGSGVSQDDNGDEGNEVIVRIGVEEEASSATDEGTVLCKLYAKRRIGCVNSLPRSRILFITFQLICKLSINSNLIYLEHPEGDSKPAVKKSGLIPLGKPTTSYITPADSASRDD